MLPTILGAVLAGTAAFFVFHLIVDFSGFAAAPRPLFLAAPGGLDAAAAGELARNSALSYWGAGLVALIVGLAAFLTRWSRAQDSRAAPAPAPEPRAVFWRPALNPYVSGLRRRHGAAPGRRFRRIEEDAPPRRRAPDRRREA